MKKLPRYWIEYATSWQHVPMAYWVHRQPEGDQWYDSETFDPPAPCPEGKKGFRILCIESRGMVFQFSSHEQLDSCIQILSMKPLPSTRRLSAIRGGSYGPNGHWLSRLPANVKSVKGRLQVVSDLKCVKAAIGT